MKNVHELYEKYYNAYKNDYDADDLSKAKRRKLDYNQFELFDKTDKKLKVDEEKKYFEEFENREKTVDKKKFREYFSYEPTALVNRLLGQNTQDLKKNWMRSNHERLN